MAEEGFLQRWSRRKAEARAPVEDREQEAPAPEGEQEATAGPPAAAEPEAAIDLADLPEIETLTYDSDFTIFLRKGVPADLRKRALQKLWRSNPTLANLDGLVEYGEDYTRAGTAGEIVRTVYQVGRGMVERLEAATADEAPAADQAAGPAPAPGERAAPAADAEAVPSAGAEADAADATLRQDAAPRPTRPRRPRPLPRRG